MKREFLLMGLAVTLFCMPVFAKADTTLTEVAAVQDADWIDGTNLLSVEGDSGYGIMEIDGTMLTDMIYTYSFSYDYGYISAIVAGDSWDCRGVLNLAGEEVVPCQYTYADILNNHWALGYMLTEADASQYDFTMTNWFSSDSDTYLLINTVDVYYMEDHTASVVATLTRDQFMDAYAAGKYINIQDRSTTSITAYDSSFTAVATDLSSIYAEQEDASDIVEYYENGQYGLKDASGNIIMEPSYYTIYSFYGGYAMVSDGELYGLIDEQGNEVLPVAYEDVLTNYYSPEDEDGNTSGYNAFGYFAAEQDGKLVFVTEGGTVVSGPAYAVDNVDLKGASATLTDMEGNELLISADGIETSLDGYSYVYALYNTSGMLYEVEDSDYNYGVIDWHGNEVLPCAYKGVDVSGDGNYLLADLDYDNSVIYQISYDVTVAMDASSEMADDAETAEETETEESTETAEETETEESTETVEETESMDTDEVADGTEPAASEAVSLLNSAVTLLETDAEANRAAVKGLLENAAVTLAGTNADAASLVNSAIILMDAETIDASSVKALISNAKSLIG